jgi:hypothetical protein
MDRTKVTLMKIDGDYILLGDDAEIPMAGQGAYCRSAAEALECYAQQASESIGIPGCVSSLSQIVVNANGHATADLIRRYGFTPMT